MYMLISPMHQKPEETAGKVCHAGTREGTSNRWHNWTRYDVFNWEEFQFLRRQLTAS